MSKQKLFVAAIALNTVLLAFASSRQLACLTHCDARHASGTVSTGPVGKFGPVIETVLAARTTDPATDILDFETGRTLAEPPFEYFNFRADVILNWVRTNGLDISGMVWPGSAACITYEMSILPVAAKCWDEITERELLANPALSPGLPVHRRQLVLGQTSGDTYIFRTGEGTLGILRLVGLDQHGQGVKIRYKLINPAKSDVPSALAHS